MIDKNTIYVLMVNSLIYYYANKSETLKKLPVWFKGLELDWIAGIGLALGIVCSFCLIPVFMVKMGWLGHHR